MQKEIAKARGKSTTSVSLANKPNPEIPDHKQDGKDSDSDDDEDDIVGPLPPKNIQPTDENTKYVLGISQKNDEITTKKISNFQV